MTITIPAGTTLYRADDAVKMYVADDSTAEIIGTGEFRTVRIKFEDGEEYLVHRAALVVGPLPQWLVLDLPPIFSNPGNNVTHVNGADVTGHGARRRIS